MTDSVFWGKGWLDRGNSIDCTVENTDNDNIILGVIIKITSNI